MFSSNIKGIMKEKKTTVRELVAQTGLSSATIDRARGAEISECRLSTLGKIANALGVSVKDTFDGEHHARSNKEE